MKRFKCFEKINSEQRKLVVDNFNSIQTKNLQDAYLCGVISSYATKRHKIVGDPEFASMKEFSYQYFIHIPGNAEKTLVCRTAFCSLHGISCKRVKLVASALANTGLPPVDQRGKHHNRPHRYRDDEIALVHAHIQSIHARRSYYYCHKTRNHMPRIKI